LVTYTVPEDEDRLIGRCLAGDRSAFEPLVERYHAPLFRVAVRMLGDREAARDATQTAFLKGYTSLASYDRKRRFFSWIYRIVCNECLNMLRAQHPAQPLRDVAGGSSADGGAEAAEIRERVRHALVLLPPDQRHVIILRHFAELSYKEIAEELSIAEDTVRSRLYEARRRLYELLAPTFSTPPCISS
jgi:RNA polymerase sigma-70 factor (ECF subfamily)